MDGFLLVVADIGMFKNVGVKLLRQSDNSSLYFRGGELISSLSKHLAHIFASLSI